MEQITIGMLKQQLLDNALIVQGLVGEALMADYEEYIAYLNSLLSTVISNITDETIYED